MNTVSVPDPPPDPKPQPRRDQYGRYLIAGRAYTRVTTIAKALDDTYNLQRWGERLVAQGVARNPLLAGQIIAANGNNRELDAICEQALQAAGGTDARVTGTMLHRFCELADLGQTPEHIPDPWAADVHAYQHTIRQHRLHPEHIEIILANPDLGYAGTADNLYRSPDGVLYVGDRKTGGFLAWRTFAIQLALYANATHIYDPATDTLTPIPPDLNREEGIIVHLPAGEARCDLYTINLTAGWDAARHAIWAHQWNARNDLHRPYNTWTTTPLPDPAPDPDDDLEGPAATPDERAVHTACFPPGEAHDIPAAAAAWAKAAHTAGAGLNFRVRPSRRRAYLAPAMVMLARIAGQADTSVDKAAAQLIHTLFPHLEAAGSMGELLAAIDHHEARELHETLTAMTAVTDGFPGATLTTN